MALEDATQAGFAHGQQERVIEELQGFKRTVVAGANANTNIPVTGIKAVDTLASVVEHSAPDETGVAACFDRTATCSITSDGNIQSTVATNTNALRRLVVTWFTKPAAIAP